MARVNKEATRRQAYEHFPSFLRSRDHALSLSAWIDGTQYDAAKDVDGNEIGKPYTPSSATTEYKDLSSRAVAPWGGLIVTTLAQTAYVDGIRAPGARDNLKAWDVMERNSWARRQIAIHRDAIGHGAAYGLVLPGKDPLTGDKMPLMRGKSATRLAAFYDDDDDEWCLFAIEAVEHPPEADGDDKGWYVRLYDEVATHYLHARGDGTDIKDWEYISYEEHPFRVPPIARCANRIDNDGRVHGEIQPVIPLLRSIDQDKFDRLIVQRFGAWKVRYIAGMAKPSSQAAANLQALRMKVEDMLISTNHETKFGTLDATDLKGFIDAHDADLRVLSAIAQIPPHHLLGLSANLQAEALAAAEASMQRKSGDFRTSAGEFHEQMARLVAIAQGETAEARLATTQVRWRDTESRSLTQAADALFKLAQGLKVPVEMLWEKIPNWTDSDSLRAKELIEQGDSIDMILAALEAEQQAALAKATQQGEPGGNGD